MKILFLSYTPLFSSLPPPPPPPSLLLFVFVCSVFSLPQRGIAAVFGTIGAAASKITVAAPRALHCPWKMQRSDTRSHGNTYRIGPVLSMPGMLAVSVTFAQAEHIMLLRNVHFDRSASLECIKIGPWNFYYYHKEDISLFTCSGVSISIIGIKLNYQRKWYCSIQKTLLELSIYIHTFSVLVHLYNGLVNINM